MEKNNIISIVTPSYNQGQFIAETIESVIFQKGDFYIDYIIMDGGSSDNTVEVIRFYEEHLKKNCISEVIDNKTYYKSKNNRNKNVQPDDVWIKNPVNPSCLGVSYTWVSEKDKGQYDAIRRGFEQAEGSVFAYINSDDMYIPNAFSFVIDVFRTSPYIQWLKGLNGYYTEKGTFSAAQVNFSNIILRRGYYDGIGRLPCLQQESTFWSRELYEKVGGMPAQYHYAGDYALWIAFSKHARLYQVPYCLGGFRFQRNQKTVNMDYYNEEVDTIIKRYPFERLAFAVFHRLFNSGLVHFAAKPFIKIFSKRKATDYLALIRRDSNS